MSDKGPPTLRVLAISETLASGGHGVHGGGFVLQQLESLTAHGIAVEIGLTPEWAPPAPLSLVWPNGRATRAAMTELPDRIGSLPTVRAPVVQPRPTRWFPGDVLDRQAAALARRLSRRPPELRPHVLYGHFLSTGGYVAVRVGEALGIPAVAIARGDDVHRWPSIWPGHRRRLDYTLAHAHTLLACSGGLAAVTRAWMTEVDRPVAVTYNGVDRHRFRPPRPGEKEAARRHLGLPPDALIALTVGAANQRKGWTHLLDAWADVSSSHPDWRLVAIAPPSGGERVDVRAESLRRGITARVEVRDGLGGDDMPALYRAADLFVHPSLSEGMSNAVLEAMASGVPTIATAVGGHAELIVDRNDGLLVPAGESEPLRSALDELMGDPAARERLARGAVAASELLGTPASNAGRLAGLLREAASRPISRG